MSWTQIAKNIIKELDTEAVQKALAKLTDVGGGAAGGKQWMAGLDTSKGKKTSWVASQGYANKLVKQDDAEINEAIVQMREVLRFSL